ncbi:MAG: glycoside hydrolase family 2 TIM barrel-domain containing protein [Candidatus Omnitrophota bacterium]|nr:glycoside hydrolase family 2 TIM barrel-domain containing protein [Candidatus Omnitrophota bacterium]
MKLNRGCKSLLGAALIALFVLCPGRHAQSEETGDANLSPKDMIVRAWEAWGAKNYERTFYWTDKCIGEYSEEAKKEQASLSDFPPTDIMDQYETLNAVGTSFFIQGEAYLSQGKIGEAKKAFSMAIKDYSFAQNWDPRGWYWSVKEKSEATIEKSEKKPDVADEKRPKPAPGFKKKPSTTITLYDPGKEAIVDYKKYGYFKNVGTDKYAYVTKDQEGLSQAAGEAIYPNTSSVNWDLNYKKVKDEGRLEGSHWDFVNTDDLEANFYKWSGAPEPQGVRMFYTGLSLEKSGLLEHAIKAYYSIVIHFPKSVGWTYFRTPWYISQVAIDRIDFLLRTHPELKMELTGARIKVENGFDDILANDRLVVNPGELRKIDFLYRVKSIVKNSILKGYIAKKGRVVKQIGDGKVDLVKYENNHWQLRVEGKPYIIKGVAYSPSKIGQSPDEGTLEDWMQADYNKNGKIDGPYDTWVDKNLNNTQDSDEKAVGDFQLLKEMGCNTIRLYHHASNKELLKELYRRYGIMVIMGDLLGAYTVGSGAGWYEGTDYANPEHRKNMLESVKKMVEEFKDEPYVLFWMLGNENNYGVANNAKRNPKAYYEFVNEAAIMIKSMDRDHPVGICNGDLTFLDICSSLAPNVDIYGSNVYRGKYGFGTSFWENAKDIWGKPVVITEYGCPAYMEGKSEEIAQEAQAEYLKNAWQDIVYNSAGSSGTGNSIGGMLFEWVDEWWKAYESSVHDSKRNWSGPFPDGWNYEEWLGVCSQGDGKSSPFLRQLRKTYFTYKEMWNK